MAHQQSAQPPLTIDKQILLETLHRSNPLEPVERLDPLGDRMAELMAAALRVVTASTGRAVRIVDVEAGSSESVSMLTGEGLGKPLTDRAASAALDQLTVATPLEAWAGEVLSSQAVATRLGLSKTSINNWRQDSAVIALPKGRRNYVYPVAQFRDHAVLPGIDGVLAAAGGDSRVAWRWLMTPHVDFDGKPPLTALQAGQAEAVVAAARRGFV